MGAEAWRPVKGYEGWYEVSDMGRVKRVAPGQGAKVGRILKPAKAKPYGHLLVNLYKNNASKVHLVHRLVLYAFVGPPPEKTEGCHFDGNASNNNLSNLRWGTSSENNLDMVRLGRSSQANRTHCPNLHPLEDPNLYWVGPKRTRRSCKSCSREQSSSRSQNREFDLDRADQYLKRFSPDLFTASVHARLAQYELKQAERENVGH